VCWYDACHLCLGCCVSDVQIYMREETRKFYERERECVCVCSVCLCLCLGCLYVGELRVSSPLWVPGSKFATLLCVRCVRERVRERGRQYV